MALVRSDLPHLTMRSAASRGWSATGASVVGLTFGPSTILLFSFGIFVAPLSQSFGWSRTEIVFGATIISLMIMVVSPLQGFLIDRFGARPVVLTSLPFFALGLFLLSRLSGNIQVFYLLCAALPVLGLGIWPVSYLRVVSTWFDRNLGLATGIANGGIGIGAAIIPLFAAFLMAQGSWRTAYLGLSLIVLVLTLPLNLLFLREARADRGATTRVGSQTGMTLREIVRTRSFVLLLVSFLLLGFVNTGLITNQIPLLIDAGITPARAAAVQSVFGISVLLARLLTGALLDRISAPRLMSVVCLGGLCGCALYAVQISDIALYVCPILIGCVFGAEFDVLSFVIKRYFGIRSFGRTYGVVFAVFQFGAAIGVTVLPFSQKFTGAYTAGLTIYAAALLISAICFIRLGPYMFGIDAAQGGTTPLDLARD